MDENDFEGSIVLEELAALGLVDDFLDAVDSDDLPKAISLLREAEINEETIAMVLKKVEDGDI
ncbi:MAG TPA: hypothetical protein VNJ08_03945 [Bacteriovoracaceae bacterium]|nr:hypothetical protein [Bacteriovoracaceae bacterium]